MPCCFKITADSVCISPQSLGATESYGGSDYCELHLPLEAKSTWTEAHVDKFMERVVELIYVPRKSEKTLWFTGAVIPRRLTVRTKTAMGSISFRGSTFAGGVSFAKSSLTADFTDAKFLGPADFDRAVLDKAIFSNATFGEVADFTGARFSTLVDFSNATFHRAAKFRSSFDGLARFTKTNFNEEANFEHATFGNRADFTSAIFSGDGIFGLSTFSSEALFDTAEFCQKATYTEAKFHGHAQFRKVVFDGNAWFAQAEFAGPAHFGNASFGGSAEFLECTFFKSATFDVASITGRAAFHQARFLGLASFVGVVFTGDADFLVLESSGIDTRFRHCNFLSAEFKAEADFTNRTFQAATCFADATFHRAPLFHGASLHQDTDFGGAKFKDTESDGAARAYGTLKRAMGDHRERSEEARFSALEQRSRRKMPSTPRVEKLFSWIYGAASDYGQSFWRPLAGLAITSGAAVAVYSYFALSNLTSILGTSEAGLLPSALGRGLEFALVQVVRPFNAWTFQGRALATDLLGSASVIVRLCALFQSLFSAVFLGLFGLAVRWRFRRE